MITRMINHLNLLADPHKVPVKWSQGKFTTKNVGDAANEFLFEKVFHKKAVNYKEVLNIGVPKFYSFIGSVLDNSAVKNLTVLGSGFKGEFSPLPVLPKEVAACRGPLTRKKLLEKGMTSVPEVYGDPAILLPEYLDPHSPKRYKMGVIPHYMDKENEQLKIWKHSKDVKIIDVYADLDDFIKDIKSCDFTMSSSLHGIIFSHAYGIPSGWLKLSDILPGGEFKFGDYSLSLDYEIQPVLPTQDLDLKSLKKEAFLPEMKKLTKELAETFKNFSL